MQPVTLAILMLVLPLLASNGAYLLSANAGLISWCIPYIDGCTTISQAGRSGDTIFYYRALVFPYSVLLMLFWVYSKKWLDYLHGYTTKSAQIILWLGVVGSIALLVYIDFLGTEGEVNRLMRRIGAMLYFILIPLAQSLLLYQHYKILRIKPDVSIKPTVLQFQLSIILLMLIIVVTSAFLVMTGNDASEMENIVEWNFSLLVNLYFAGMVLIWKDYRQVFTLSVAKDN
jgi:hypothetical protein